MERVGGYLIGFEGYLLWAGYWHNCHKSEFIGIL